MKLSDDFDNEHIKSGISLGTMIVGVLFFVGIVVVAVLLANKKQFDGNNNPLSEPFYTQKESATQSQTDLSANDLISHSDLVSDDLDFWDMYKEDHSFEEKKDVVESVDYSEKLKQLEKENLKIKN